MLRFSTLWCGINIILIIFYLFFVSQAIILRIDEKETLKKDETVYNCLLYFSLYEIVLIFVLFAKTLYLIILRIDHIDEETITDRIVNLEFFAFIPQIINFFLLVAQISYYDGIRFKHKKEFLQIYDFKMYCEIKKVVGLFYIFWLISSSLIFMINFMCLGCNYCRGCREECGCFEKTNYIQKRIRGNNKIYAV